MPDHQRDWLAVLQEAQRHQEIYSRLIVAVDIAIGDIIKMLSPSGEATDQLANIGLDLIPVVHSKATKDVMAAVKLVSEDHKRAIAQLEAARNTAARAHTHSMMILARIQRAIDDVGNV